MVMILDGKQKALEIKEMLKKKVDTFIKQGFRPPHLAIIVVGDDPASHTYIKGKINACKSVGYDYTLYQFAQTISEEKLLKNVKSLNEDQDIDGFIVQIPLPPKISVEKITECITPEKDVDGFTNQNFGSITSKRQLLLPATPLGICELLKMYNIETESKNIVIVGGSRIVGSPLSLMLHHEGKATVTICNKYTENIKSFTKNADILIVAVGKPRLITEDMIKENAVVIDVGITRIADDTKKTGFRLSGDVCFEEAKNKVSAITPVPGGVGPMTIAALLQNTLKAYESTFRK